jgi:squalene-hopene/tetraprenyl-beta-curcumene cyclase
MNSDRLASAYQRALDALLRERTPDGHWVGELSSSALSTATAVSALSLVQRAGHGEFDHPIEGGLSWLAVHQNPDGGWGDTVKSLSNISTGMLCRAAFHIADRAGEPRFAACLNRAEEYLRQNCGETIPQQAEAIRARYGKDRTFSVPILMTCALAGQIPWREVPALPFELACFPQSWFRFLKLPVVSYALPALIAIGQCIYFHRPPWNPLSRLVRRLARRRSLRVLETILPTSGGFLEASPLTSFVTMSLASIGQAGHPVTRKAVEFLVRSVRSDGSWPIDTDLSTWVTTLAVNALESAGELETLPSLSELSDWLLNQQYKVRHPYTGADPGGWAWTPLSGGVPDGDDTPGAMLALRHLRDPHGVDSEWSRSAVAWLSGLQNADGGWPTFCRGWGTLPFDRSGCDLTAHALRALHFFRTLEGVDRVIRRGFEYLARQQRPDGSWVPLWFGNQQHPAEENPTYGTARVLAAYCDLDMMNTDPARRGLRWLLRAQNPDGGWGAGCDPSSVEETALAVEVLLSAGPEADVAVNKGLTWLVEQVESGGLERPTPIGFYFAKLWYYEKLYPIIFTVAALGRATRHLRTRRDSTTVREPLWPPLPNPPATANPSDPVPPT